MSNELGTGLLAEHEALWVRAARRQTPRAAFGLNQGTEIVVVDRRFGCVNLFIFSNINKFILRQEKSSMVNRRYPVLEFVPMSCRGEAASRTERHQSAKSPRSERQRAYALHGLFMATVTTAVINGLTCFLRNDERSVAECLSAWL
ncbi:hypothetical protein EVAR_33324_1 [Eumeta japonica]|uniref:Uncharacterized protein n=1 Tax=Eumeta variegata TaxID=151549 RepID=A0A4C1WFT5_EUMVA|nr:hypothetical protein EVAR_33324_1 [Eumeta japonica]